MLTLQLERGQPLPPIPGHGGSPGPFAIVSLTDTGCGIEPEHVGRIFEPFYTTKEVGKGTGLGLSQVFTFAKQSGGDVAVESTPGQGTTFRLFLPQVDDQPITKHNDDAAGASTDGEGRHVLVVEDNIEVGTFATQILQDLGSETTWATNAEDALMRFGDDD